MDGREFRLRRRDEGRWKRISLDLQPRSACLLDGRARWEWDSIARAIPLRSGTAWEVRVKRSGGWHRRGNDYSGHALMWDSSSLRVASVLCIQGRSPRLRVALHAAARSPGIPHKRDQIAHRLQAGKLSPTRESKVGVRNLELVLHLVQALFEPVTI